MESPSPQESDFLQQAREQRCPAVDVRTAAGQKLNPLLSLFFLFVHLSLTFSFIHKFELRQCQPGKPKGTRPAQDFHVVDGWDC